MQSRHAVVLFIIALCSACSSDGGSSPQDAGGSNDAGAATPDSGGGAPGNGGGSGDAALAGDAQGACPASQPDVDSECTTRGLTCTFGNTQCSCEVGFGNQALWECSSTGGGGGAMQMCPASEPAQGSACTPARGDCDYGTRMCDCLNSSSTWSCFDPADCPASAPAEQAACDTVGMECEYDQGLDCECTSAGWDCGRQVCPAAQPTTGSACDGGDGSCAYGATTCDCTNQDTWLCWSAMDCPAAQPAPMAACSLMGISCDYANGPCRCGMSGWSCQGQFCPDAEPMAGAACQGGNGVCAYGAAKTCDCDQSLWVCWNPADCPAAAPAQAAACTLKGMICAFPTASCECDGPTGWDCDPVAP
ncbi:MAG TPA: hypothetical protein VFZ61_02250 [Polyangiales bacterium]